MKRKALYMVAVLALLITTACGNPKLKNGEEVIAKINDKEYTADELYEELKGQYGYSVIMNWVDTTIANSEIETTDEIKEYADEALEFYQSYANTYSMSLVDFATSYLGLTNVSSEDDIRNYIILDRKLTLAIQNRLADKMEDSEVEKYYNENYKIVYTFREILLADDDDAKETIEKIKSELKGKKDDDLVKEFESLAKKYSKDSKAENGSLYEKTTKNTVNEDVWKELEDLDDYEYSDEIKTNDGYYIVLKISKDDAKELKEVKDEIKTSLAQEKLNSNQYLSYDILTELRNKYKLVFYDSSIKKQYDNFLSQLDDAKEQSSNSNSNSDSNSN